MTRNMTCDKKQVMVSYQIQTMPLEKLVPWEENPRRISKKAYAGLKKSIDKFGCVVPLVWNKRTGRIVSGHQRARVLREKGAKEVPVVVVDLTEEQEKALNITLNNPNITGFFDERLKVILDEIKLVDAELIDTLQLNDLKRYDFDAAAETLTKENEEFLKELNPDTKRQKTAADIEALDQADPKNCNVIFESDNAYGVPTLRLDMCAQGVHEPVVSFREMIGHKLRYRDTEVGAIDFYTFDKFHFDKLWENPENLKQYIPETARVYACVEVNYSIYDNAPMAIALYQIFRKRYVARYWQQMGLHIYVDAFINPSLYGDIMFLGVPRGWASYATRARKDKMSELAEIYKRCWEWSEGAKDFCLVIIGGAKEAQKFASEHKGCIAYYADPSEPQRR